MATPEEMAQTMIDNLPAKTGKSLAEWLDLLVAKGEMKHGEMVKFLKSDHGMGHGFANLVAHTRLNPRPTEGDGLVDDQYSGTKSGLLPIYDRLIEAVKAFGDDVEIAPKKTYVSLRRNKQFGLIQASTKTRVDVGLNLKDEPPTERLELSGSFNGMVSHRVRVNDVEEVDGPLVAWLREAYEGA